jgi:hypothetical protein
MKRILFGLLWLVLFAGSGCAFGGGSTRLPKTLPDATANQQYIATKNGEIKIQVGHFLSDDLSEIHFLGSLRKEGVLGVYLRVQNRSPTRVLIANTDCHLYGKTGGKYVEIPRLRMGDVASEFAQSTVYERYISIPLGVLFMVWPPSGITIIYAGRQGLKKKNLENGIFYEHFSALAWGKRALGPGGISKGVLFFDWEKAEPYRDDLYMAIDLRDMVNDWHTVLPVKLRVHYREGVFSTTYY